MTKTELRLAVFDCDGTIVDSQYSIIACMHAAFDTYQLPLPNRESIRRVVGLPLLDAVADLIPEAERDVIEGIRTEYGRAWHFLRETEGLDEPLFPGLKELLDALETQGWLLGIATGKSRRGLHGTLEKHDILDKFATLQTADHARGKPQPDMLYQAMNETGVSAAGTVMIGDTTFDMEMARNAGVVAIGVSWGYHDAEELRQMGAADVINTFEELPRVLTT